MNPQREPHATADYAPDADDPLRTTDPERGSASTDASAPGSPSPVALPHVLGYRVLREIARGGMGRVLAADDLALEREVALKVLLPGANPDRFVRESKITARLPHPGIPPVYALGTLADGSPYLAMKLVAGRTLAVERKTADRTRLLEAFVQVCQAVGFAHSRGIIHRDLKPANVMVGAFGEVQVMDWGLAKILADGDEAPAHPTVDPVRTDADQTEDYGSSGESTDDQTRAGTVLGTPLYMSPEVAKGLPATKASDVYGLGAILHVLLCGRPPYAGKTAAEVLEQVATAPPVLFREGHSDVPPVLAAICQKAMQRNPEARYPSSEALEADVRRWLADEPVSAYREPWSTRATRWAKKRRTLVFSVGVLLTTATVASAVAAVLVWLEQKQTKTQWERAEGEKVKATENADSAITVVRDLSRYIQQVELSGGQTVSDQQRKTALDAALASYERLLALNPDDAILQEHVARTHRYRANLCRTLNESIEAEKSYGEARRLYGDLTKSDPDKTRYREDLARTSRDFAIFVKTLGRLKEAGDNLDESIRTYEALHNAKPELVAYRSLLAMMSFDRAELAYQLCRFADAERHAHRSAELYGFTTKYDIGAPEPFDRMFHGMAEIAQAQALRELGRVDEAIAVHDVAVKRLNDLAKVNATRDIVHQFYHAKAERAWTYARVPGRIDAGITDLTSVIDGWEKLAKQYPLIPAYVRSQGRAALYRGRLNVLRKQPNAAQTDFELAAKLLEVLVKKYPSIPTYRSYLGQVEMALGQIHTDPGKSAERYRRARELLEAAMKQSPEDALFQRALSELDDLAKKTKP
jgi:serine/threonine protein kinase